MLFLDGVYVQDPNGKYGFRHTRPPTVELLHELLQQISQRVARFLERRGILERDEDNADRLLVEHFEIGAEFRRKASLNATERAAAAGASRSSGRAR